MCHGFRGSRIGPHRSFVQLARRLQSAGLSALRFDQYGSGDSDGDFFDSSFDHWVETISTLADRYHAEGYNVALLGQSMGGAAVIAAAARLGARITSVVAWVPDPSIDEPIETGDVMEEGGERVNWAFWREAHQANIPRCFGEILAPTLTFFATEDQFVSAANQRALVNAAQTHQEFVWLYAHSHSSWTYEQTDAVLDRTQRFLLGHFTSEMNASGI